VLLRLALSVAAVMTGVACAQRLDPIRNNYFIVGSLTAADMNGGPVRRLGRARSRESFAARLDSGIGVVTGDIVSPHQQSREPTKGVVMAFHELVNIGLIVG
jgi:hypothetical protein